MSKRQMHLVAVCTSGAELGAWRHPSAQNRFTDPKWWGHAAQTLEDARFDAIFFADGQTFHGDEMLRKGGDLYLIDPVPLAAAIATQTEKIGIGITISTSLVEPYAIARSMQTLDALSGGRMAWNVVTSKNDDEAKLYGRPSLPPKNDRYDRADEVVEACVQLWDSFPSTALLAERDSNTYIDPMKLKRVDFEGKYVKVQGVLSAPASPQGRPVIMQAGASPRGREFAAKWAEIVFTYQRNAEGMQAFRADMNRRFIEAGRSPEDCIILPPVQVIVGETEEIAEAKRQYLYSLIDSDVALQRVARYTEWDVTAVDPHAKIDDLDLSELRPGGAPDVFFGTMRSEDLTVVEAAVKFAFSDLGLEIVGTPDQVADQMEHVFNTWGNDGFIINQIVIPDFFEDFGRMVVPILQERGLVRKEYTGNTLKEHARQNEG